jgi:cell division protein FtsN
MREMHKWKDKVELSLDNRQIFFLFFGLSVIGCFVFALGIMTGRRLQWEPGQEAAAIGNEDSLALLDETEDTDERFAFRSGLSQSDAEALPPTRDPELPPRDEDEVRAERAAAAEQGDVAAAIEQREAQAAEVEAQIAEQQQALAQTTPEAAQKPKPAPAKLTDTNAAKPAAPAEALAAGRQFTLQMKAFSREEDASKLAAKLRHNGHEVRVESHEVRGRTWHRVRLGAFDDWDEALAAKQAFEKAEHVIAYVVSL